MKQAIPVRVLPATDTKPVRVKASTERHQFTISYGSRHADINDAYQEAAQTLKARLNWPGRMIAGVVSGGSVVFVFADSDLIIE